MEDSNLNQVQDKFSDHLTSTPNRKISTDESNLKLNEIVDEVNNDAESIRNEFENKLTQFMKDIEKLNERILSSSQLIDKKDQLLIERQNAIDKLESEIKKLKKGLNEANKLDEQKSNELNEMRTNLLLKEQQIIDKEKEIVNQNRLLSEQAFTIEQLKFERDQAMELVKIKEQLLESFKKENKENLEKIERQIISIKEFTGNKDCFEKLIRDLILVVKDQTTVEISRNQQKKKLDATIKKIENLESLVTRSRSYLDVLRSTIQWRNDDEMINLQQEKEELTEKVELFENLTQEFGNKINGLLNKIESIINII